MPNSAIFLEVKPVCINAKNYSAMNRSRFFWTNISKTKRLENKDFASAENMTLQEHLTPNLHRVAVVKKIRTVTTNKNSLSKSDGSSQVMMNGQQSTISVTELEKIFGLPEHYTDVLNLSPRQRQLLLGKSWSVTVIQAILEPLKEFFLNEAESSDMEISEEVASNSDESDLPDIEMVDIKPQVLI